MVKEFISLLKLGLWKKMIFIWVRLLGGWLLILGRCIISEFGRRWGKRLGGVAIIWGGFCWLMHRALSSAQTLWKKNKLWSNLWKIHFHHDSPRRSSSLGQATWIPTRIFTKTLSEIWSIFQSRTGMGSRWKMEYELYKETFWRGWGFGGWWEIFEGGWEGAGEGRLGVWL